MTGLTASVLLQAMLLAPAAQPYSNAYHASLDSGKPLVVLVGADWCPACVTMKQQTIPTLEANGAFEGVEFSTINLDNNRPLAKKLMRGGTIPQLILFEKTATGWRRQQLTGLQTQATIKGMLQPAVARHNSVIIQTSASVDVETEVEN